MVDLSNSGEISRQKAKHDKLAETGAEEFQARREKEISQGFRIEALRAASRIVAGAYAGGKLVVAGENDEVNCIREVTTNLAEYLAHWLETGER